MQHHCPYCQTLLCFFPSQERFLLQKQAAKWNTKPLYHLGHSWVQKQELTELVIQNQHVFSSEPGHNYLVQHIITEPRKIKWRPYRIPEDRWEAIRMEVKIMLEAGLEAGIIEKLSGAAPLVLKPECTVCFCNDLRKLNKISKFYAYPMPKID